MLEYRRLSNGLLEVKESLMSFFETRVRYWYYDTTNWKQSSHGKHGDPADREMTPSAIAWVQKYYLPKVA